MVLAIVNEKLAAEGKQKVNNAERKWILKNMGIKDEDSSVLSPPQMPQKKRSTKSKTEYINQLEQKIIYVRIKC